MINHALTKDQKALQWFYFLISICHLELTAIFGWLSTVLLAGWDYWATPGFRESKVSPGQKQICLITGFLLLKSPRANCPTFRDNQTSANQTPTSSSEVILKLPCHLHPILQSCGTRVVWIVTWRLPPLMATKNIAVIWASWHTPANPALAEAWQGHLLV